MQMEQGLHNPFLLVVLLEEPLAESALLGGQVKQFLVVEPAAEILGKHLGDESAAGSYLSADIDDDGIIHG